MFVMPYVVIDAQIAMQNNPRGNANIGADGILCDIEVKLAGDVQNQEFKHHEYHAMTK